MKIVTPSRPMISSALPGSKRGSSVRQPPREIVAFSEHVWPYGLRFRGFGDQKSILREQPVQRLCYACDEYSRQFFIKDAEHPYTFPEDKPFMWIRGRQVGGKTFCWARISYRYSDNELQAASRDGYEENWPVAYKDLEPCVKLVLYIGVQERIPLSL